VSGTRDGVDGVNGVVVIVVRPTAGTTVARQAALLHLVAVLNVIDNTKEMLRLLLRLAVRRSLFDNS